MPQFRINIINFICFLMLFLFSIGAQTTLWFQIFKNLPAPWIWLNIILYLILFRKPLEGILLVYCLTLFTFPFTSMKLGVIWMICLLIFVTITYIKKRIFWPNYRYFFYASLGINVLFQIFYISYSKITEKNPLSILISHRLIEIFISSLFSFPVYYLATRIDYFTNKEFLPEAGGAKK